MVTQERARPPLGAREPLAVAVVAVVAAVGVVVLASQRPPTIDFFGPVVTRAFILTGWAYLAAGVLVRRRDTGRMIGALLLLAGALWFAQALFLSRNGWVFTLGVALSNRHLAVVVHILLALPHGQLTRTARRLVILTYTVAAALSLLAPITYAQRCPAPACPSPRPTIASPAWVQDLLLGTDRVGTSLIAVAVGVVLVVRLRRSGGATRRALAPVFFAGALLTSAYVVAQLELLPAEPALWLYFVTQALMPLSVLLGAARARLHRGAVAELVVALDRGAVGDGLRDALARCLGDPTLRLAFPVEPTGHIDASGEHLRLDDEPGRAQTPVEQDGRTIAVLDHDRTLLDEPDLLDAAVAASRLALRNAQLTAQVRAQLGELQRSRTRLVVAVDAERRRLERDLHDGVQQHLLAVALELGRLRNQARANGDGSLVAPLARTIADLEHAIDELRRFARGLHPQVLTDRGVPAALEALALRAPLPIEIHADLGRLPHEVESTLYLVATEALANTLRHGDASHLRIDARQTAGRVLMDIADDGRGGARAGNGTGLAGLQDRLSALGGGVTLESPRGQGTRLHVEIPVLAG